MNIWLMLSAVVFGFMSPAAGGAEPAAAKGWKQKQFIITFWCPPPATEEALAAVAAEHYSLTWVPVEGLDVAAKHGLRAMLTSDLLNPAVLDDAAKRAQLDALIERVKKHPALEAYFITDEPGAGAFSGLGKLVAYLRERDPAHLAYINLFPTYANNDQLGTKGDTVAAYKEHLRQYVEIVKPDLISYDHYHFMKDGSDGHQYFLNLALIRSAAIEAGKPFLNIIQASVVEKVWRLPNAAETRFLVYTTLAYGGRGISYFIYWGPKSYGGLYQEGKPSPMAKEVAALNAEMEKLGPALISLDSLAVYHTAPLPSGTEAVPNDAPVQIIGQGEFVLGLFGSSGRPSAFMVVNRNYKEDAEAVLKVAVPGRKTEELDRKTGTWSKSESLGADRTVKIKLSPGDGRLFRVAE